MWSFGSSSMDFNLTWKSVSTWPDCKLLILYFFVGHPNFLGLGLKWNLSLQWTSWWSVWHSALGITLYGGHHCNLFGVLLCSQWDVSALTEVASRWFSSCSFVGTLYWWWQVGVLHRTRVVTVHCHFTFQYHVCQVHLSRLLNPDPLWRWNHQIIWSYHLQGCYAGGCHGESRTCLFQQVQPVELGSTH